MGRKQIYSSVERKERHRQANSKYREAHPEKIKNYHKEYNKEYYKLHCERIKVQVKRYRESHKKYYEKYHKEYNNTISGYLRHIFHAMKQRCNNPKTHNYNRYGGRGIKNLFKSSDELIDYVVNVLKVDPHGLQIDRIDNDGNYEPGNIRFVTSKENIMNKG